MKRIFFSFFLLSLFLLINPQAQAQKVINKISKNTCDCLEDFKLERDPEIIREVLSRCINAAVEANAKSLFKTFGDINNDQKAIGEIGRLVTKKLGENCPAFENLSVRLETDGGDNSAQEWFDKGEEYLEAGDLGKAEGAYSRAISLSPESDICFNKRGLVRRMRGDYYGALADFRRAIELSDYEYAAAYLNIANTKNILGDESSALEDINRSIELDPEEDVAYQIKGHILSDMGEYGSAEKSYRFGAELDPENLYAFYNLGRLFLSMDNYDSAIVNFDKSIAMGGTDDPDIYNYRGLAYARMEEHRLAISDFSMAIRLEDEDPAHFFNRAISYKGLGMYDSAYVDFNYTIEIEDDAPENYFERGQLLGEMNRLEEAIADYDRVLELDPERATTMDARGAAKAEINDFAGALKDFNSSLELYPNDEVILYQRGMVKSELGDEEGACEDLKRASAMGDEDAKEELGKRDCGC